MKNDSIMAEWCATWKVLFPTIPPPTENNMRILIRECVPFAGAEILSVLLAVQIRVERGQLRPYGLETMDITIARHALEALHDVVTRTYPLSATTSRVPHITQRQMDAIRDARNDQAVVDRFIDQQCRLSEEPLSKTTYEPHDEPVITF